MSRPSRPRMETLDYFSTEPAEPLPLVRPARSAARQARVAEDLMRARSRPRASTDVPSVPLLREILLGAEARPRITIVEAAAPAPPDEPLAAPKPTRRRGLALALAFVAVAVASFAAGVRYHDRFRASAHPIASLHHAWSSLAR